MLRAFADDNERVRVVGRGGRSFVTGTHNIGLETEFFGKSGPGTSDDSITQEEQRIAPLLKTMNAAAEGEVNARAAAELLAHLTVRAKSFRTLMQEMGDIAFDVMDRKFSDGDHVREMLRESLRTDPSILIEEFRKMVRSRFGPAALAELEAHPLYPALIVRIQEWGAQHVDRLDPQSLGEGMHQVLSGLRPKVDNLVNGAHKKIALTDPTPAPRVNRLARLSFAVQDFAEELVLGDGVGYGLRPSRGIVPLFELTDDLKVVVMPTSRFRALVGWRDDRPNLEAPTVRLASVETSEEFFVVHPSGPDVSYLSGSFGKGRAATLEAIAAEARKLLPRNPV